MKSSKITYLLMVSILFIGIGCLKTTPTGRKYMPADNKIYENGVEAYKNRVPANANPYINSCGQIWLEGWIDAKNDEEGKTN